MFLALIVWLVMTVLPALNSMATFMVFAIAFFLAAVFFFSLITEGEYWDKTKPVLKHLKWAIPLAFLLQLVPSERTSWYMVGAYTTQTIAQSETGKELASDGVDVLKSLMKKAKEKIDAYDVSDKPKEEAKK